MKALFAVLIGASVVASLNKNSSEFLEVNEEDDYTPNPDEYTENGWDLAWVILSSAIDDSNDRDYAFEYLRSCVLDDSVEELVEGMDYFCSIDEPAAIFYADSIYNLYMIMEECEGTNDWDIYVGLVFDYYFVIDAEFGLFLATGTRNKSTNEDDSDSILSTLLSGDTPIYTDSIVIIEGDVIVNECQDAVEESEDLEEEIEEYILTPEEIIDNFAAYFNAIC